RHPHLSSDRNRCVSGHPCGRNREVDTKGSKRRAVRWDVSDCWVAARKPEGDELRKRCTNNSYVSLRGSSAGDSVTEGQLKMRGFVHPDASLSDSITEGGGHADCGSPSHCMG